MKNKKIYVVDGSKIYANWLLNAGMELTPYIEKADLVMFTGGEDVNPALYKQKPNVRTHFNAKRDIIETIAFNKAKQLNIPCLGICRGAQFLTVMSGGKLIQHVDHHAGRRHKIKFCDNSSFEVTSTHHQMMYPYDMDMLDYSLLGYAYQQAEVFEFESSNDLVVFPDAAYLTLNHTEPMEPEVVYYPKTNCLAIQSHPEHMDFTEEAVVKFTELVKSFIKKEIYF